MRSQRQKRHDVARRVEDLEGRVVLSAFGAFGSWQTMMRGAAAGAPAQVQRAAPVSFSPSPFQYAQTPARAFGSGGPTWQGINQTYPGRVPGAYNFNPVANTPTTPGWNVVVGPQTRPSYYYSGAATMRINPLNSQNPSTPPPPTTTPTTSTTAPPVATLPTNVSGVLNTLYQNYNSFIAENPNGTFYPSPVSGLTVANGKVAVYVNGNGQGDFATLVSSLEGVGMNISATNAVTWTVSGMLPINALPTVATDPQTLSIAPRYGPTTQGGMRF